MLASELTSSVRAAVAMSPLLTGGGRMAEVIRSRPMEGVLLRGPASFGMRLLLTGLSRWGFEVFDLVAAWFVCLLSCHCLSPQGYYMAQHDYEAGRVEREKLCYRSYMKEVVAGLPCRPVASGMI
jgi:hypothetical protein